MTDLKLLKGYLEEAVKLEADKELIGTKLKETYDAVKESEAKLDMSLAEFKQLVKTALDEEKISTEVAVRTKALDTLSLLKDI